MTRLDRPVRRETDTYKRDGGRARALIVELHPTHLQLRRKGTRRVLSIPYDAVYDAAAKMLARADRADKLEAKKKGKR